MTIALFAGSFDPITNGHLDIINSASKIFDKVVVAVAFNPNKKSFIPLEKRLELIKCATSGILNLEVDFYEGLTVDYASKHDIQVLIRGVRSILDFDYEMNLANMNKKLNPNISTCVLFASLENQSLSSSAVKEILLNNGDIKAFVPSCVYEYFLKQINEIN